MPNPKPYRSTLDIDAADEETIPANPVDTDENDEPFADASGDSEDETPDENEAADDWYEGEK